MISPLGRSLRADERFYHPSAGHFRVH